MDISGRSWALLMVFLSFFEDTLDWIILACFYLNTSCFKERLNRALDLSDRGQQIKGPISISGVQSETLIAPTMRRADLFDHEKHLVFPAIKSTGIGSAGLPGDVKGMQSGLDTA